MKRATDPKKFQGGFALIEGLVSVLILSVTIIPLINGFDYLFDRNSKAVSSLNSYKEIMNSIRSAQSTGHLDSAVSYRSLMIGEEAYRLYTFSNGGTGIEIVIK
ncbi:MAG: hypothetical protein IBX55_01225 [Methyloprofundus sp.]|nr:hypothetical protein [Methyloprofundus sp.]